MRLRLLALAAACLAAPTVAQQPGVPVPGAVAGPEDVPVSQVIIYGDDPCPPGSDEVIVVCLRLSESDRYRIPPNLREDPNAPVNQSWANRAVELSYVGRTGTDSCSTVGAGGFTGCLNQVISQARAERRGSDQVNWARMIEEARQERLSRIDAEAEAAEEEAQRPD